MRHKGFTLIELVVSVAIVALLASLVVPVGQLAVKREKERELRQALREMRTALDAYRQAVDDKRIDVNLTKSGYPSSLQVLVDGVNDMQSPDKRSKLKFLRRIPRDPFAQDAAQSNDATWGKRSYASSPDNPVAGDDVFDVYSLSPQSGLNGTPYRKW
jgi:general secretion pathway protein G